MQPLDHGAYLQYAIALARKSPPKPTNFCVGAVLINEVNNQIISTGYTLELPGNTHAEQCCLMKLERETVSKGELPSDELMVLYTTLEPCNKRASGNAPCVDTILETHCWGAGRGIRKVYVGVQEPVKFVGANEGKERLEEAGVEYIHIPGYAEEILKVATAGHER